MCIEKSTMSGVENTLTVIGNAHLIHGTNVCQTRKPYHQYIETTIVDHRFYNTITIDGEFHEQISNDSVLVSTDNCMGTYT